MILVTGATGTVGRALLPQLLERGEEVRVLVRDPRKLGRLRVEVRIALGDLVELGDPRVIRQALRGAETVIHLAAAIRDQPHAPVEELNGLATARLLRAAERSGVDRFVFFSAIGATEFQRTRFFRAKALAERAVLDADLDDDRLRTLDRLRPRRPLGDDHAAPGAAAGRSRSPARARPRMSRSGPATSRTASSPSLANGAGGTRRLELAGPQRLTYDQIARLIAHASGRDRPLMHVPLGLVHYGLAGLRRLVGDAAFATWEEAELMEVPMVVGAGHGRRRGARGRAQADGGGARLAAQVLVSVRSA